MNKTLSIYLDFVRFSAACIVFLIHARYARITGGTLGDLGDYANDAVMVFFVLSGFVIAFVASTSETTPSDYIVARLSLVVSCDPRPDLDRGCRLCGVANGRSTVRGRLV